MKVLALALAGSGSLLLPACHSFRSHYHYSNFYRPSALINDAGAHEWEKYYTGVTGFGADYTFTVNSAGRKVLQSMGKEETYGEIEPRGMRVVLDAVRDTIDSSDVMYDLGSGVGKVVAQFAIETKCGRCVGIELGERRHKNAVAAWNELKASDLFAQQTERMHFINGDMLATNWTDATVLFVNAVCYPPQLWNELEKLITKDCHRLKCLILGGQTLSPVFLDSWGGTCQDIKVAASWQEDMVMTLYIKSS